MPTKMKVYIPKDMLKDVKKIERAIDNALDGAAAAAHVDFKVTTRTWNHKPPFFIRTPKPGVRDVYTTSDIYRYVSGGTRVRRALMSPDFIPKSKFRWIGSGPGQGGVVLISKKLNLPGIKAREFEEAIGEKWDKELPVILQRAIDSEI